MIPRFAIFLQTIRGVGGTSRVVIDDEVKGQSSAPYKDDSLMH